jgi:hypothetical protein
VTQIVISIREGDRAKVIPLWERYFERLTHHAAKHLRYSPSGWDEDAAISAFNDFCNGLAEGKFDYVDKREVLWGTLAKITERKAFRLKQRFKKEVTFTDLQGNQASDGDGVSRIAVLEPTDEYGGIVRVEIDDLIQALKNDLWREAARMAIEGYSVRQIAEKLGRTRSCVHVWFRTIRQLWENDPGRENLLG